MEENLKIAAFFDAENIPSDKVPLIIDYLSTKGDILFQRAYADWSISNIKSWKDQLNKTPITAIQQFHHNEKQAVDKLIMMDAIEMAIKQDSINTFALIASDNGYHSLALRLREIGKRVIGIGEKDKCNPIWIKSCNEFSYLEDLADNDEEVLLNDEDKSDNDGLTDYSLEKFLENAFDLTPYYKGTDTKLLSQMWETVYRQKSDFNVRDYGCVTPRELISKFDKKFKLSDDGKSQRTIFVEKIETKEDGNRKNGIIKRRIKNYRIICADDGSGDYFFYMPEINKNFKGEILEKGTKVNFQVIKKPNDSENLENENGRATDVKVIK
ncbi:MAG: NYN domain-containing protein [Treponema sp.]|jgi:cold shock CspA family protein|nr:NYN domain-containing protein [Treponema sp.]